VFKDSKAFSSFSVDDVERARTFYGETLGLKTSAEMGQLVLHIAGGGTVFVYGKGADHSPASFTVLNLQIPAGSIDQTVDELAAAGVKFEHYDGQGGAPSTDEKGINRDEGPTIAWFKDPAGNVLSIVEVD
jgi:catechol 2,3-dioxygenase-like lactoylglutathione lyase family enzyme